MGDIADAIHKLNTQTFGFKVLLAVDDFACAVIFRDFDCTISAETGKAMRHPETAPRWAKVLYKILPAGHCEAAIWFDIQRAKTTIAYLEAP